MACGTGDVNLSGAYPYVNTVNGAGMNYHLTGGAARDLVPVEREQPRAPTSTARRGRRARGATPAPTSPPAEPA